MSFEIMGVLVFIPPIPLPTKGDPHKNAPSESRSATNLLSVWATTIFVPAIVAIIGEPYCDPSPAHCHFSSPVAKFNAAITPLVAPPSCAMQRPSSIRGELEVKNGGHAFGTDSFRQITFRNTTVSRAIHK